MYVELLATLAIAATHQSQLGQDFEIYASQEFGLVELADAHSRASALMPQKKNPYALAAIRTQAGQAAGDVASALATLHTGSARTDHFHLLNGTVPRALDEAVAIARLTASVLDGIELRPERFEQIARESFVTAADVADVLALDRRASTTAARTRSSDARSASSSSRRAADAADAGPPRRGGRGHDRRGRSRSTRRRCAARSIPRRAPPPAGRPGRRRQAAMEEMLDGIRATLTDHESWSEAAREREAAAERRCSRAPASSPDDEGLLDPELVGEPVDPVGLRLVVQRMVGLVPLDLGPLRGGRDHGLERRAGDDRVLPARLDQDLALRVVDPRERVDRLEHLADHGLELRGRALDVGVHRRRARGHEHGGPHAVVDTRDERREPAAHAPADKPEPVGIDAVVVGEQVEPRRAAITSSAIVPPCQRTSSSPVAPAGGVLRAGRSGDRERDGAALRELHRRVELLLAVTSGAVEKDDRRDLFARRGRRDEVALDPVVAARERDVFHDHAVALRVRSVLQVERRAVVVGERVVGLAARAVAAAAAAREEEADGDREESVAHSDEDTLAGMEAERDERLVRAASFGAVADAYERARPGYPEDAVRWLAGDEPCDVVDLGAGTGKLTRSLVALGHRVTAVEPLEEMLDRLRVAVPGAIAVRGSAEEIPLTDGSADVVTCAQAFHWFDPRLRSPRWPGCCGRAGRIALVWNTRDDAQGWVAELTDTVIGRSEFRTGGVNATTDGSTRAGSSGRSSGRRSPTCSCSGGRISSSSSAPAASARCSRKTERAPVLERVEALFDAHARDGVLAMPYVTECFRAVRR